MSRSTSPSDSHKPDACEYRAGVCARRFCATCVVVAADINFSGVVDDTRATCAVTQRCRIRPWRS